MYGRKEDNLMMKSRGWPTDAKTTAMRRPSSENVMSPTDFFLSLPGRRMNVLLASNSTNRSAQIHVLDIPEDVRCEGQRQAGTLYRTAGADHLLCAEGNGERAGLGTPFLVLSLSEPDRCAFVKKIDNIVMLPVMFSGAMVNHHFDRCTSSCREPVWNV